LSEVDLILWRHAEAHAHPDLVNGCPGDPADRARSLTSRGEKQAARMAGWLDRQLPSGVLVLSSPALRAQRTASALERKFKVNEILAPEGDPVALLDLAQWPVAKQPVVVVGHQPTLGRVVARLLGLAEEDCAIKKGALWWVRHRVRDGVAKTVVVTVQTPELL
jgi:phosphohistidine phosphatase